jgi:chromosomal replication initiation ATPase DnaA
VHGCDALLDAIPMIRDFRSRESRVEAEKPESRQVFRLEIEEIVNATAREYGKGVAELKRRKRGAENEARIVAIYLSRHLGGHKQGEIGKRVRLENTSSVSSAYLQMKARMTEERLRVRRVRRIEDALLKSKRRP